MKNRFALLAAGVVLAATMIGLNPMQPAGATHQPANKTSAAGSSVEVAGPNTRVVLLSERIKTSAPTDLILQVTAECALTTDVATTGNDEANASGEIKVHVEIDGKPVLVAADDADKGRVTFCNRAYGRTTSLFDDTNATIETFFRTRDAHGFNWMALDVGSGIHKVEVIGYLDQKTNGDATAKAVIGNRTLIIEPTKAANDEDVTAIG